MAASSLDERYLELARSMEIASIPERIRCATCDKLAINAVKLPCCDSPVCGDCQRDKLPTYTECPICMHAPFAADMGVPAKSLQTTVKVFIKNEAKKRGIDLKTGAKIVADTSVPAEPVDTPAPVAALSTPVDTEMTTAVGGELQASGLYDKSTPAVEIEATPVVEKQSESGDVIRENDEKSGDKEQDEDDDEEDDVVITTERPEQEDQQYYQVDKGEQEQDGSTANSGGVIPNQNMHVDNNQQGFGFDQSMAGFGNAGFGNMNMGINGFNPMMGMPGFGMGMPNMMGMPGMGMGMDPSMMFNGSFGGMGDMSMMGMGNMGGAMSGMGDYNGMGGPGFVSNQGSYMQSNYGNAHRQNFFNDRGYGRGYGRGFGRGARGNQFGRGRGGWGYQQQNQYNQNQQYSQQQQVGGPQQSGANDMDVVSRRRASPSYETGLGAAGGDPSAALTDQPSATETGTNQDAGAETNMVVDSTNKAVESTNQFLENGDSAALAQEGVSHDRSQENGAADGNGDGLQGEAMQIERSDIQNGVANETDVPASYQQNLGQNFGSRGGHRGGRGGFGRAQDSTELTPAPAPPINAPTGPKAMRQGLPNTGWAGRSLTQAKPSHTPAPEGKATSQSMGYSKDDSKRYDEQQDRGRSSTRSRSRSKRRDSRDKERNDGYESDETYARRKERERRKRKEREERYDEERAASKDDDKRSKKYRSRSQSRTDDSSRRRHRDKEDDHRSSRSHRDRSKDRHRRRHRSRSPVKDYGPDEHSRRKSKSHHERDTDHEGGDRSKDSKRSSRRHSTRDNDDDYHKDDRKDRSHRSSKHGRSSKDDPSDHETERPRPIIEPPSDELGFKIKGSRSAKANKENTTTSAMPPPSSTNSRHDRRGSAHDASGPASSDPYAEERARAQQNREAREAQRRMSSSTSLGKRGREDDEPFDAPKGPKGSKPVRAVVRKGRRVNYKYEDEVSGGDADERDAGRWR